MIRSLRDCYLYGILDLGYVDRHDALSTARRMVTGGVDILQLRAKKLNSLEIESLAREILPITREAEIPFIVNDHPEIAGRVGAEGTHIGQDDGSLDQARATAKGFVGRSTHSLAQARAALAEGADYIGFGPLFATPTKPDYTPIGLADLHQVHREVDLPIFCIGGIKREHLPTLVSHGLRRAVVVSGILQAADIEGYIASCREHLLAARA